MLFRSPYTIAGRTYYPTENTHYSAVGFASWYGDAFHGRRTANGEVYDMRSLSAAHPTMPLPSYARVTNLANGYSMVVRVNDRGPYSGGRIIDVSSRVADMLAIKSTGTAKVKVDYIGAAPLEGADDTMLAGSLRTDGGPAKLNGGATMVADAEPPEPPQQQMASPPPQPFAAPRPMAVERPRDAGPPFVAAASPRLLKAPAPPPRPFDLGEIARVLHTASNAPTPPLRRPQLASARERALYFADPPTPDLRRPGDDPFARLIAADRR